jgi:regulator-associated protein of mTOR
MRYDELDDEADEEFYDLGARHGFEDHYLSEDIIAQLANVSNSSLMRFPA